VSATAAEFPAFVFLVAELPLARTLADAVELPSEVRRCTFFLCPEAAHGRVQFPAADSAFSDEELRLGTAFMKRFVETIARRFQRTGVYTPYHVRGWRDAAVDDVCAALEAAGVRVVRAPELMAEIGHDLTLADFPFQSQPIPAGGDVVAAAARQLLAAAGLPEHFVPWLEAGGHYGEPITEPEVRVGLRICSMRKKTESRSWTVIELSAATFGARTGALLAWSADLDPELYHRSSGPYRLSVNDNRAGPNVIDCVLLDKDVTARLRALAAGGKVRPAKASAEMPLSHDENVSAIAIAPDGAHIASVGHDGRLRIWDARTDTQTASVVVGRRSINAVDFSPNDATVATGPVRPVLLSIPSGKRRRQIAGHPRGDIKGLRFSPSGALLATASSRRMHESGADHSVALWDAGTGEPVWRWTLPVQYRELCITFAPDERRLFVFGLAPWGTSAGGTLWALDIATRAAQPCAECQPEGAYSGVERDALVATATEVVVTGGNDAWIFDASTLNLKRKLRLVDRSNLVVRGSAPSPDGSRVALVTSSLAIEDAVEIVSLDGGAVLERFAIPAGTLGWTSSARGCLAWSASGKTVAAAHGPRVFHWDVKQ
jgi:hypothetical protein